MNDGDKKRFAVAMNWLAEKVARDGEPTELTKQQLADYFKALKNLSIGAVESAVNNYFAGSRYRIFPLPGEIRAAVPGGTMDGDVPRLPQRTAPVLDPDALKEYQRESTALFTFVQSDAPLDEKLYRMGLMERAFPGFGWGEQMDEMERACIKLQADNAARYERIAEMRKNPSMDSA